MRSALLTIVLTIMALPGAAQQQGPQLHPFHELWFFSAPVNHDDFPRIFYQVCNRSGDSSAFRWYGAGFGVAASAQLPPDFCAFKNTYSEAQSSPKLHEVLVQGRGTGDVRTWTLDSPDSVFDRMYSYVEAAITSPDGIVDQSVISIDVRIDESGAGDLRISSSGVFDSVIVHFPEASFDVGDLLNLGDRDATVSIGSLRQHTSNSSPATQILFEDQDETRQVFRLEGQGGSNFSALFFSEEAFELGSFIVIFGLVDGDIVIVNEAVLPRSPG